MSVMKTKIEKLKIQREQLEARIQNLEAAEKQRERKQDTRRKILIGSYYLDNAVKNGTYDQLKSEISTYLKRDSDRILFGLPLIEKEIA